MKGTQRFGMFFVSRRKDIRMNEDVACRADDLMTAGGEQDWQKLLLGGSGTYEVTWDTEAAVTPMGSLVYFGQYLSTGGLLDGLVADCPLEYRSGNAPGKREVIGTTVLAILNGQTLVTDQGAKTESGQSHGQSGTTMS
jgi:hypothetical protein